MSKRLAIVAIAATAVMGFAVSQAPAGKKHSHATLQKYVQVPVFTPAFDIGGGVVSCPSGSVATGGGVDYVDGIAHVSNMGFGSTTSYYVLVDNFNNSISSQVEVQVACTAGTSKVRAREISPAPAAAEKMLEKKVADLKAAHRAAE